MFFLLSDKDDDNGEWMQLLRPSELREVLELDRARKEVERQIIHANQVCTTMPTFRRSTLSSEGNRPGKGRKNPRRKALHKRRNSVMNWISIAVVM